MEDPDLVAALTAVLSDRDLEPAFVAQVIALPSEADIAREIASNVDPDAVFGARQATAPRDRGSAVELLDEDLRAPVGARALFARRRRRRPARPKNACLDLLTATGEASAIARAMRQYERPTT